LINFTKTIVEIKGNLYQEECDYIILNHCLASPPYYALITPTEFLLFLQDVHSYSMSRMMLKSMPYILVSYLFRFNIPRFRQQSSYLVNKPTNTSRKAMHVIA
jgi:hypothetical protein